MVQEQHQFRTSPAIFEILHSSQNSHTQEMSHKNPDWILLMPIYNTMMTISSKLCGVTKSKLNFLETTMLSRFGAMEQPTFRRTPYLL